MHVFNQSMVSGSKLDATLLGHYMKSFFSTVAKYFAVYQRSLAAHLEHLGRESPVASRETLLSMMQQSLRLGSLQKDAFPSRATLSGSLPNLLLQKALVESRTRESSAPGDPPAELSTVVSRWGDQDPRGRRIGAARARALPRGRVRGAGDVPGAPACPLFLQNEPRAAPANGDLRLQRG